MASDEDHESGWQTMESGECGFGWEGEWEERD